MLHLKKAFQWLRPALTGSPVWDYCVVWKLSDGQVSRSIEWVDCFCVGGSDGDLGFSNSTTLCRDTFNPHSASKKSCLALAHLPFSLHFSSGLYEEVVVSGQPRWINFADKFALEALNEAIGTRVLIPVFGGLVELFSTEQIMESQEIMEFVAAQFNVSSHLKTMCPLNCKDEEMSQGEDEQQYRSKNLIAERKRRARIKRGMCDLRAQVPKITKMSQAATLEDAIAYIEEMETKVKALQEELQELEKDEIVRASSEPRLGRHQQVSLAGSLSQVQVEVYQLSVGDFMIKILCKATFGAFTRLLENLGSLGLQIKDVTAFFCKGVISSSFMVQANNGETEVGKLRDALVNLSCC